MIHHLEADSIQLAVNGRPLLSSIYLKCTTGKITGLLGRNGVGKSCLMKCIYGTIRCEKSVRINGTAQREAFKRPGLLRYLPQFNFVPKPLSLKRVFLDFELDFSAFTQLFPEFHAKYKTSISALSGGEHRLVELYVVVKSSALFVLLDEPFTHLSPLQIEKAKELLVEAKATKGLLVTDHLYRQVIDVCDDVYVLSEGKTYLATSLADIEAFGYARI